MATITCGNCAATHRSVATVRACYAGEVTPCDWLVERSIYAIYPDVEPAELADYDEGPQVVPCGAASWADERGWYCEDGHSHIWSEVRHAEGWEYAADPLEAKLLASAGVFPMTMDGTGPSEIAR